MQLNKVCAQCGIEKSIKEFSRLTKSTNYKSQNQTHHTYCKSCNAERANEWRKANPGYRGSGKLKSIPEQDRLLMSCLRQRITDCKGRAKKYNQPDVTINADMLYQMWKNQNGLCAISGIKMNTESKHLGCVSIDKINPDLGYIVGNVQLTCWAVNRAKGEMPQDMFIQMCQQIVENQKVQRLSKSSES